MRIIYSVVILLFLTTACSTKPFDSSASLDVTKLAHLTGFDIDDGFITIKTVSYGCTFVDSFEVVSTAQNNAIAIKSVKPDECHMSPRLVALQYSFRHLNVDLTKPVNVVNPVKTTSDIAAVRTTKQLAYQR